MKAKNYGLVIEPPQPQDFSFGSSNSLETKFAGREILRPDADWRSVLFDGIYSHQAPGYETNSCVTHGTLNAYELTYKQQFSRYYDFSDRFLAKVGETNPAVGATPKQIAEAFRKKFSVYELDWSTKDANTLEDFYALIPANLMTLAAGRGAEWDIGWQYVGLNTNLLRESLKYSPLGISVYAWKLENGEYVRPQGAQDNHWVCLLHIDEQGRYHILDSYEPFIKILRADFLPQVAVSYHLQRQIKDERSWLQYLIDLVLAAWKPAIAVATAPQKPADTTPVVETAQARLLHQAESYEGTDPTPKDSTDDEVACASSLSFIIRTLYPDFPYSTYTPNTLKDLKASPHFVATLDCEAGNVIINATKSGNGTLQGHCGIISKDGRVFSNDSRNGKWTTYYTLESWKARYRIKGGMTTHIFKPK